ncbi:hypothetical protein BA059_05125 [Mycolicibacterium sp. (ex Dasyatis americana)]|uniref:hypothetical protein n=1 Tax=Mycobacterium sp. DBP42 TaxID=2545267 RepID=UPI000872250A|nr:hypothetical protein [Mycobacterium sp. DBP42]OFB42587.1 hypothetical protein BA059_05125 [Mycolicibacterium sp. (ex Dasyatis americana)]TMS50403.1 hypothetical protein E0T84_24155 [Mycobacterium sp. DBP42]
MPRHTHADDASSPRPTEEQAATYDRLVPMLEAAHREMTELSKKKQDGIVNTLKIKMLNRLLGELSKIIENDPSHAFVDMLDEETLPQNSDAVLILSQWQAALKQFKDRHYGHDKLTYEHRWFTVENPS